MKIKGQQRVCVLARNATSAPPTNNRPKKLTRVELLEGRINAVSTELLDAKMRLNRILSHPDTLRTLHWFGRVDDFTGYGQFGVQMLAQFARIGDPSVECIWTHGSGFQHSVCPPEVQAMHRTALPSKGVGKCLFVHPQLTNFTSLPPFDSIYWFTMWESTRVPAHWVEQINRCKALIVPCAWCATSFEASGVRVPIEIVRQGIKPEAWPRACLPPDRPLVFGSSGSYDPQDHRKGLSKVIPAFRRAFPFEDDVRLEVKAMGGIDFPVRDPRITVRSDWCSPEQMSRWYAGLHAYVNASAGEGWGMHLQEAMHVGRPVIGPMFSGVTEFFSADNGYAVDYRLVPGRGHWENAGLYAEVSVDDLARRMREVYHDRSTLEAKSVLAHHAAAKWTVARSAKRILQVLEYEHAH